jgi:hypothetical protein
MVDYKYIIPWPVMIPPVFSQVENEYIINVLVFDSNFKKNNDHNNFIAYVCFRSNKEPTISWHHKYPRYARRINKNFILEKQSIIDAATLTFLQFPDLK